jgi:hypothetical protein
MELLEQKKHSFLPERTGGSPAGGPTGEKLVAFEMTPLPIESLSEGLKKVLGPGAPAALKMMAARGLAPLKPGEQVTALFQLSVDPDEKLRQAAEKSASELQDKVVGTALADALDPKVLHFIAQKLSTRPGLLEPILLNRGTADETVVYLASIASERDLELIGTNEERILRSPQILTAMYLNKRTRQSTIDRLIELCVRNNVRADGIPSFDEAAAAVMEQGGASQAEQEAIDAAFAFARDEAEAAQAEAEAEAVRRGVSVEELIDLDVGYEDERGDEEDAPVKRAAKPVEEKSKKKIRIQDLSMTAKIRLATTGSTFHRAILIRDTKKQVSLAAVKSPAVTEREVEAWASNRSLPEEVLRYIASSRVYTKDYAVKKSLCFNSKVPVALTMGLLPHLQLADLIKLSKSRNVSQTIVSTARRIVAQRKDKK